ncbi:MAG: YlxM family DNA-binding protein [Clostridiales bacterium]|nr:YlxM family DNA-binding protein [Clostridiales bacterium]MCF8022605.1 YlxM family DNA-binding protein [Clostridiales bacterium]
MEKVAWITLLYDFYGQLLTDRQRKFIDLYYGNDFSLGEISENLSVSRQAVHDGLKRAESILQGYEDKLGLVARFLQQRRKLSEVVGLLENIDNTIQTDSIMKARKLLEEMLEIERT